MTTTGAVNAIGALADPIRRRLYNYVSQQRDAVSREEAAEALSLPLTKTKFHLERLTKEGLLDVEYRRMSGRQGPGAGRPSKLYRRAEAEISVSLPERRYDLMGDILAGAVMRNQQGESLQPAIEAVAYEKGELAATRMNDAIQVAEDPGTPPANVNSAAPDNGQVRQNHLDRAGVVLTRLGYEPERGTTGDPALETERRNAAQDSLPEFDSAAHHDPESHLGATAQPCCGGGPSSTSPANPHAPELLLRNCPFDALAQEHRELVCGTNQHFVQGVLDGAGCRSLRADLEPHSGYCCVVVREQTDGNTNEASGPGA